MSHSGARALVSDPGMRPDLRFIAAGLAAEGMLGTYATSVAFSHGSRFLRSESRIAAVRRLQRFARLRQLPADFDSVRVRRLTTAFEAAKFVSRQTGVLGEATSQINRLQTRLFDRRVARMVRPSDALVVGMYSASEQTFRSARAKGVKTLLNYPIAHHAWANELLAEEVALVPEFASTIQYVGHSQAVRDQISRELELVDFVHCLSSFHANTMTLAGVPVEKQLTSPLGVDLELFRPLERSKGSARGFRVVFVGQITQRKGISYLLDGFQRAAIPGSELLLVGRPSGPAAALLERPGVRVVPGVPRSELPAIYATADLFVMPSLVEGFCQTAMEAMACGVPTVVTPNTFGDDVISDGVEGWTIPIRDPDAIASCIARVADPGFDWEEMSRAARARATEYSWPRVTGQLLDNLASVIR